MSDEHTTTAAYQAMRACIVYARDRRGSMFDFDTWNQMVEHALQSGQVPPNALEEAQSNEARVLTVLANVRDERDAVIRQRDQARADVRLWMKRAESTHADGVRAYEETKAALEIAISERDKLALKLSILASATDELRDLYAISNHTKRLEAEAERDALRTQLEAMTKERDEWKVKAELALADSTRVHGPLVEQRDAAIARAENAEAKLAQGEYAAPPGRVPRDDGGVAFAIAALVQNPPPPTPALVAQLTEAAEQRLVEIRNEHQRLLTRVECDTAEAIATWLDKKDTLICTDLAECIRDGAWRAQVNNCQSPPVMSTESREALNDIEAAAVERLSTLTDAEHKALGVRCTSGAGTIDDHLASALAELRIADQVLPPSAPSNGRAVDGFHASCCIERAMTSLRIARRILP